MVRKSSNIIEGLLFVWKDELLKEKRDGTLIPFVLKQDIDAYNQLNQKFILVEYSIKFIKIILKLLIRDYTIDTKQIEEYLKNQKLYFLIKEDQVSIFQNNQLISNYGLKEISIKPTLYDSLIYLYYITCPNLTLGDCYVLIEDSLTLKNSFTFLGRPSYDSLEEDEQHNK